MQRARRGAISAKNTLLYLDERPTPACTFKGIFIAD